ncbi:hypothetical protein GCM10028822_08850 [Hymenobacter terrigena]
MLTGFGARAQGPVVVSANLSPARHAPAAARNSAVSVPFSQNINPATAGAIRVFSSQGGGRRTATIGASAGTVTLAPTAPNGQLPDFKPGETVQVSVPGSVQNAGGTGASPFVYQFTAATMGGTGAFTGGTEVPSGSQPWGVAVADVDGDGDLDLLTANYGAATVSLRLNNGLGTYTGGTELSTGGPPITVVTADIDADGDLDILTANYYGSVGVLRNNGGGSFASVVQVSVGLQAKSLAMGDFDGDGDLDLATGNTSMGSVSVRFNNGQGVFSGTTELVVGQVLAWMTLGDVDNDGDLDVLAAVNETSRSVLRIMRNNGLGQFSGSADAVLNFYTDCLAAGDLDADGDLDLVTANLLDASACAYLNDGTGHFTFFEYRPVGLRPSNVALGDVDGDGDLDVLASSTTANTVTLLLNSGGANFIVGGTVAVGSTPQGMALGDLDGDGDLDLLAANSGGAAISVRFNPARLVPLVPLALVRTEPTANARAVARRSTVEMVFSQPVNFSSIGGARVFSAQYGGRRTVSYNTSSFSPNNYGVTMEPQAKSGFLYQARGFQPGEVVAVTVSRTVQSNSTGGSMTQPYVYQFTVAADSAAGSFGPAPEVPVGRQPFGVAPADVDGDGDVDLLVANAGDNTVSVRLNDGRGLFIAKAEVAVGQRPYQVVPADVDGDGDLDFISVGRGISSMVSIRLNDGSGNFSPGSDPAVSTSALGVAVGDVDGDGDLDFVVSTNIGSAVSVYVNNGAGIFQWVPQSSVLNGMQSVVLADIDADGDLDLLGTDVANNRVIIAPNNGKGTFGGAGFSNTLAVGRSPWRLAVADVDGDNDLDILTANYDGQSVSVRLNNGRGSFGGTTDVPVGNGPKWVTTGDVNGDGTLDLLVTNGTDGTLTVGLNDGQGNFSATAPVPAGLNPVSTAVADVDGDGDLDLLTTGLGLPGAPAAVAVSLNAPARHSSLPGIEVYPNPATTPAALWVDLPPAAWKGEVRVAVFSSMGRHLLDVVLPGVPGQGGRALPALALLPGVYVLRASTTIGTFSQRLTVQ